MRHGAFNDSGRFVELTAANTVSVDAKVAQVRAHLPAVHRTGYFNAGTNGPLPDLAIAALTEAATTELAHGRIGPEVYERLKNDWQQLRERIASILGADVSEIALTRSTTEGVNIALFGMDWRRGDEIITTTLERPGILTPLALLAHRFGANIRYADIGSGGGDVAGAILDQITSRTRAIAISHVMWSTGAVIPLNDIAAVARRHGLVVVVDAAQAAGQVPPRLHESGIDAYAASGQKWLCGPGGTGTLYIRSDRLTHFKPTYIRAAQSEPSGFLLPAPDATRYEIGEFYTPALLAQHATLTWLEDEVGLDWMYERIASLGRRCWDALAQIDGISVVTPRDRMAGIVSFSVTGMHPRDLTEAVEAKGFTIRYVEYAPGPTVARVSNSWWNTEEEVDGLVAAIGQVAASL
jgi:L-cysteine/cystine lyase